MMSCLHLKRKALFLSRLSRREEAIESALISLAGFRWNWSAWTLLGSCIGDGEEVIPHLLTTGFCSLFYSYRLSSNYFRLLQTIH